MTKILTFRPASRMLIALATGLALLLAACGGDGASAPADSNDGASAPADSNDGASAPAVVALEPSNRYVHVQATELDARRGVDQDPFPQATLDEWPEYFGEDGRGGDGGYYLFMSAEDEWRIGSYLFLPQQMTFVQGDTVTMEIFGVRGSEHETVLESPSGETLDHFTVRRGELHQIEFTAEEPGVYQLICITHPPTMTADVTVLPSRS